MIWLIIITLILFVVASIAHVAVVADPPGRRVETREAVYNGLSYLIIGTVVFSIGWLYFGIFD